LPWPAGPELEIISSASSPPGRASAPAGLVVFPHHCHRRRPKKGGKGERSLKDGPLKEQVSQPFKMTHRGFQTSLIKN